MNSALSNLITSIAVMAVFNDVDRMLSAFIGPKLEKSLGRPLTEWDWQVYWEESIRRAEFEACREILNERLARWNDLKTIHDFVWVGNSNSL